MPIDITTDKSDVNFTIHNQIASIIINRPDAHNALNLAVTDRLLEILQELNKMPSVRVVILKTSGKNFCAGADLDWIQQAEQAPPLTNESIALKLATLMDTLYRLNKATIALVQGAVIGGGVGLVCCCDLVLATPDAHFCCPEVRLGLIPATISPYVINAIGARATKRYFLSAETFSAKKAVDLGLVHKILPQNEWPDYIKKWSGHITTAGPQAVARTKQLINDVAHSQLNAALIYQTAEWLLEVQSSAEAQEGITAFQENRPARWVHAPQKKS